MIDETVRSLVRTIFHDGDLSAAAALLDRLEDLGDSRRGVLMDGLGLLAMNAGDMAAADSQRMRRRLSAEEQAYRRDEAAFRAWSEFAHGLRRHFWAELAEVPLAKCLADTAQTLDASKQAKRFADRQAMAADDDEEVGNMMGESFRGGPAKGW